MGAFAYLGPNWYVADGTLDLSQAANTYDLFTASGDIMSLGTAIISLAAATTFTSVEVSVNFSTAFVILTTANGARANWTSGAAMTTTLGVNQKGLYIPSGKKVQYTIAGSTGTGSGRMVCVYRPLSAGARLA